MNRTTLQKLCGERSRDAQILLASGQWPSAYYLAGYALECALKSCVLAYIDRTGIIFSDKKYVQECWTHDIESLVRQAGLSDERNKLGAVNNAIATNWLVAKDWSEISRYQFRTQLEAEKLFKAINDPSNGVLPWVKTYW